MVDLESPVEVRQLLKKLWCHGQAVAPVQGLAYAVWATSDDTSVSFSFRVLLWVAAVKFPLWGYLSWRALQLTFRQSSFRVLVLLGLLVIALDVVIAAVACSNGELSKPWPLVAFIFTVLHAIETTAFLSATSCFKWALLEPAFVYRSVPE